MIQNITDWPSVVNATLSMMAAAGVVDANITGTADDHWSAPSWRRAAIDYHKNRPTYPVIAPPRIERLRRLMAHDVLLERAWIALQFHKGKL